jgi:hypothetical protein
MAWASLRDGRYPREPCVAWLRASADVRMPGMNSQPSFGTDGPFFPMVSTFLVSTVGLGPLYEAGNPLKLSADSAAWYQGLVEPELVIDLEQIRQLTQHLPVSRAVQELCGMLVISAYAVAFDHPGFEGTVRESPEGEFFRHVRHAAAHGNRFTFKPKEPRRRAAWRTVTLSRATHANIQCFGNILNAADALSLLDDMQRMMVEASRLMTTGPSISP